MAIDATRDQIAVCEATSIVTSFEIRLDHANLHGEPSGFEITAGNGDFLGDADICEIVFQGSFRRVTARSVRDPKVLFEAKVPLGQSIAAGTRVAISCDPVDLIVTTR